MASSDGPFYSASVLHLLADPLDRRTLLAKLGALLTVLGTLLAKIGAQPVERLALAPERRCATAQASMGGASLAPGEDQGKGAEGISRRRFRRGSTRSSCERRCRT